MEGNENNMTNGSEKEPRPLLPEKELPQETKDGLAVLPHDEEDSFLEENDMVLEKREATDIVLGQVTLILMSGTSVNQGFHFTFLKSRPTLFIGSAREKCGEHSIVLQDESVSECHASIRWKEGNFYLQDEGAEQGTYMESRRLVQYTSCPLKPRCTIRFGNVACQYRLEFPDFLNLNQARQRKPETEKKAKEGEGAEGFVISEFSLLSLDAPCALPHHCEIRSNNPNFLIGRAPHCHYQVEFKDKYVAQEQALVVYSANEQTFAIKGLVKENPIFVNNRKVKDFERIKSGDVIRLGVATHAPKIRFTIAGDEKAAKEIIHLSEVLDSMERGKTYRLGNSPECEIQIADPSVSGQIVELKVPQRGDHLLVTLKEGARVKVMIDSVELLEKESRALTLHQTMEIGTLYEVSHDHQSFISPRTPTQVLFSEVVSTPKRGDIYGIGSASHCKFNIADPQVPPIVAEISVPLEGDYFLVKRLSSGKISVTIDQQEISDNPRMETRFGINQVLAVDDYLHIRNNRRTLPPATAIFPWKKLFRAVFVCLFLSLLSFAIVYGIRKYWDEFNFLLSTQELMQRCQKNVFYIMVFNKDGKNNSSGTGFLYVQKDAQDKDVYYVITCKHVIEPWKFSKHLQKDGKTLDEKGNEIDTNYYIAIWPYNAAALDPVDKNYLFQNSFTNHAFKGRLGDVEVYRKGKDIFQEVGDGYRQHMNRSNEDIAVLKLKPEIQATPPAQEPAEWKYPYQSWHMTEKKKFAVGEGVIVLGYSAGGGRLLNKNGVAVPVSCEGKTASECQAPDFLEINVNQTQGASGGPIISHKGEIIGVVSFSDQDKKLIYGIHATLLVELMR